MKTPLLSALLIVSCCFCLSAQKPSFHSGFAVHYAGQRFFPGIHSNVHFRLTEHLSAGLSFFKSLQSAPDHTEFSYPSPDLLLFQPELRLSLPQFPAGCYLSINASWQALKLPQFQNATLSTLRRAADTQSEKSNKRVALGLTIGRKMQLTPRLSLDCFAGMNFQSVRKGQDLLPRSINTQAAAYPSSNFKENGYQFGLLVGYNF